MRPSRHQMYLAMARAAASRATCYRLNVGAVLVENRNIVGIGYNGAPSGQPHCSGQGCTYFTLQGCKVVHAEMNAMDRAQGAGVCELYVTHSPCDGCATRIIESVTRVISTHDPIVSSVYFETAYRIATPVERLVAAGVDVHQVLPNGFLVDCATGQLKAET